MNSAQKRRFVLIGVPRVGSNYFISKINQHPDVLCHFEVYSLDSVYTAFPESFTTKGAKGERFADRKKRDQDPIRFMEDIYSTGAEKAIGFNIFPNQCSIVLDHVMQDKSVKKIFLRRNNLLSSYISLQIAKNNNAWNSLKSRMLTLEDKMFTLDINNFENYIVDTLAFYDSLTRRLDTSAQEYHVVKYENMIGSSKAFSDVYRYLGLPDHIGNRGTVFKKENSEEVSDIVINYRELKDYCASKGYGFI
jgi:hypothetical protein